MYLKVVGALLSPAYHDEEVQSSSGEIPLYVLQIWHLKQYMTLIFDVWVNILVKVLSGVV
jgi:hypothetical protein